MRWNRTFVFAFVTALTIGSSLLLTAQAPGPVPHPLGPSAQPFGPSANSSRSQAVPGAAAGPAQLTQQDLAAFLDGLVPFEINREDIAGAVVVVVKDGQVLYAKGYGYSDVAKKLPVDPENTLFRPGSVSKLFTWTAVMQQVQQGKIDLHADINQYLDFKVPAAYGQPITMWNLMTHTPGFEEAIKGLITGPKAHEQSLHDYLVTHMPERVYPPGTTPAYSNYGATLAGYIVQRVSGMPFDDYVEKNIFQPLGMAHSTFRQPLPAGLTLSQGYKVGSQEARPFEIIAAEPAGSLTSSGIDMSHFMMAHLQNGQYNGASILNPDTVALMHTAQYAADPALPHMCLGFYEETRNGHRIIGHAGDTQWFHSDLHLMQDQNLGFFVSYNSGGRGEIDNRGALFQAFLDRYYPYTLPATTPQPNAVADAQTVAGEYITSRRPVSNILSFIGVLENLTVKPGKDGTITVPGFPFFKTLGQVPKTFVEIGPLLYRDKDGQDEIGFTRDYDNRLVLSMDFPFMVWTRAGLADNKTWNMTIIIFFVVVSILTLLWWPISIWVRKHYGHPLALSPGQRRAHMLIRIVLAVDLVYLLCWVVLMVKSGGEPLFDTSLDPTLRLIQIVGWVGTIGTIFALISLLRLWRASGEWWVSRIGNVAIAIAVVGFSWFLFHWHMLHFSLNY